MGCLVRPWCAGRVQNALHENEVAPAAEFTSDLGHARDLDKAGACMQPDRSTIAAVDAGDQHMFAERGRGGNQFVDENAAMAAPTVPGVDVNAVLDAVTIARPGPEIAERPVAENVGAFGGDENGIAECAAGLHPDQPVGFAIRLLRPDRS